MPYLIAEPETMTAAAGDLAALASTLEAAHASAAPATTEILPAAADEVSAGIAELFTQHAQDYQALLARATVFHEGFAQNLANGAASYQILDTVWAQLLANIQNLQRDPPPGPIYLTLELLYGSAFLALLPFVLSQFVSFG